VAPKGDRRVDTRRLDGVAGGGAPRRLIRTAEADDVLGMVQLSERKRREYERVRPQFWRMGVDSRTVQKAYFESIIASTLKICLVHEDGGRIDGFLVADLRPPPPVYDPGGLICVIDDFAVAQPELWNGIGRNLLTEVMALARERGAVQAVVVCGHHDEPKRRMLEATGFPLVSEWRIRAL